ncbi:MAG: hypothetical protein AAFW81_05885 [Pseudomonadota bacterium]
MQTLFNSVAFARGVAAALASLAILGCETTIPASDTTPPRVELRLSGPGGGSVSNPPREVWTGPGGVQYMELNAGGEYGFTVIVSDTGGVASAALQLDQDIEIVSLDNASSVSNTVSGLSRILRITGARARPLTALTISGRLRFRELNNPSVGAETVSTVMRASGSDFGGASGPANTTNLELQYTYERP